MESREIDECKSSDSELKIEDIIKSTNNLKTAMYSYDWKSILIYASVNDHKYLIRTKIQWLMLRRTKLNLDLKQMSTLEIQNLINIHIKQSHWDNNNDAINILNEKECEAIDCYSDI